MAKGRKAAHSAAFLFLQKTTRLHNAVGLITDKAGRLLSLSSKTVLNHYSSDMSETVLFNAVIKCVPFYNAGYNISFP